MPESVMVAATCLLLLSVQKGPAQLKSGLVVTTTSTFKQVVYKLPNEDETLVKPAVTVRGKGITIDFNNCMMEGSPQSAEPDARKGLGLLIEGDDITIKNLKIRGYKVALMAKKCKNLKLIDCDLSYNWKQHLMSNTEREDESDWMSYHHNEADEWLRYGAGAYLKECDNFEVKNLHVTGGQCGLMLTKCNQGTVWNCDLSFNSGLGLGMYRSSGNKVMHNKLDWCVRGYSHGVYNRGQDSAGILIFEQCSNNVFAYNSATHGGDGFFLWAGQQTMDTGKGGCNDNLLYANDLSHSPANAIEATFSRNKFINNLLIDSWHGVWGGYSYGTLIAGNVFALNGESIAIEHGQNNVIQNNSFNQDTVSIYLWQNTSAPDPNWGYPKDKDVRNIGTKVSRNFIGGAAETAVLLGPSTNVEVTENVLMNPVTAFKFTGEQSGVTVAKNTVMASGTEPTVPGVTMMGNTWSKSKFDPEKPWMTRGGNSIVANEPPNPGYFAKFHTNWAPDVDMPKVVEEAKAQGNTAGLESIKSISENYVKPMSGGQDAFLAEGAFRGRKYILVDEWGPYDFKRPLLWAREKTVAKASSIDSNAQVQETESDGQVFEILGPKGNWRVAKLSKGVVLSEQNGTVPGKVTAYWPKDSQNIQIELEYVGQKTTDYRGVVTPEGRLVNFSWSKSFIPIQWQVQFWPWDETSDPRTKAEAYEKVMAGTPVATFKGSELSFASGGSPMQGVPADHFATRAQGTFSVEEGAYKLNVTADDGVKVWLDDKLIIDEWHWQGPTLFTKDIDLSAGSHTLRVQHFEIDGYTTLKVEIKRRKK